jgi:outer membrane lipoprotein carrier protein
MNTPRTPIGLPLVLLALLGMALAAAAQSAPDRLDAVLSAYEAATAKMTTLQAKLIHTKTNKMLNVSETIKATLKMKRPRKLLLDATEPAPSKKVINGDVAWVYEPQLNQAQKFDISRNTNHVTGLNPLELAYTGKLDDLKRQYAITLAGEEKADGKTFVSLQLKLKDEDAESKYSTINLKMEEGQWIPIEIRTADDSGETEEQYRLSDLAVNKNISDSDFNFTPPFGVEVVEPQKQ